MGPLPPTLPKPPLIPSKNALRALRRLALSPSTLVIGAIGGACGVASLDYNSRRKIQVAQKIIQNKHVLRSVSSGTAEHRLKTMFDAAERGEDFTLPKRAPGRKHNARSLSNLAQVEIENPPSTKAETYEPVTPTSYQEYRPPNWHKSRAPSKPQFHDQSGPASQHTTPQKPQSVRPPYHRIHNDNHYGTRELEAKRHPSYTPNDPTHSSALFQPLIHGRVKPQLTLQNQRPGNFRPRFAEAEDLVESPIRAVSSRSQPESQLLPLNVPYSNASSRTRPSSLVKPVDDSADLTSSKTPSVLDLHSSPNPLKLKKALEFAEPNSAEAVKTIIGSIGIPSTLSFSKDCLTLPRPQAVSDILDDPLNRHDFAHFSDFIFGASDTSPTSQALRWTSILEFFVDRGTAADFDLAEAWYLQYRGYFPLEMAYIPPVLQLVEHLLSIDTNSERAAEILYPSESAYIWLSVPEGGVHARAVEYLRFSLWRDGDFTAHLSEFGKVIALARSRKLTPSDDLVIPLLQSLIDAANLKDAQRLLEELENKYGLVATQHSLEALTLGFALDNQWQNVSEVLNSMHEKGHSRSQPIRFQLFFAKIMDLYCHTNTAERCVNFAIDHIKFSGLVACADVSRALVCVAIRDGRHELIVEWGRLIEKLYTHVDLGYQNYESLMYFVGVWDELGISCAEIASACRAMALGARKDPFNDTMRSAVWKLVRKDLFYRLSHSFPEVIGRDEFKTTQTTSIITLASELCNSETLPAKKHSIDDLKLQLQSIDDLKKTFRGDNGHDVFDLKSFREKTPSFRHSRRTDMEKDSQRRSGKSISSNIDSLTSQISPKLIATKFGLAQQFRELETNHPEARSLLKFFVRQLVSRGRTSQALALLEHFYESDAVQGPDGIPYDEELFSQWLSLAYKYGPVHSGTRALWAIIESQRHLPFSQHFSMLTVYTYISEFRKKSGFGATRLVPDDKYAVELRHLYQHIKRIKRNKRSHFNDKPDFPEWQTWEQKLGKVKYEDIEFMTL